MDYLWKTTGIYWQPSEEAAQSVEKLRKRKGVISPWIMSIREKTRASAGDFYVFAATTLSSGVIAGILVLTFS